MTQLLDERVREGFSRFLSADPRRLHVAAHSHHPWPDVTLDAQVQAWTDAAARHDHKWEHVFGTVIPEFQGHVARRLGLSKPTSVVVAPNTHELVGRLLSCLGERPHVLTTDAEFQSVARQLARLEEDGAVHVERVAAEPFDGLQERLTQAVSRGGHDLVYFSHVLFDSGYVVANLDAVVAAVPDEGTLVVIDGYHSYMALPTNLSGVEDRAFYLAGGYKYAMGGEGAAFMHCPPGYGTRPRDTGWYAGFSALDGGPVTGQVSYGADGSRFLGATFDPSGLYRSNAAQRWLEGQDIDVHSIHAHVRELQRRFVAAARGDALRESFASTLVPPDVARDRGNFLTFRLSGADRVHTRLRERGVLVDHRGDRLRLGFGMYHRVSDVDAIWARIDECLVQPVS